MDWDIGDKFNFVSEALVYTIEEHPNPDKVYVSWDEGRSRVDYRKEHITDNFNGGWDIEIVESARIGLIKKRIKRHEF